MYTYNNKVTNPYYNLALEEFLLKEYDLEEDLFYVWRNEPSVIYGRNQNPFKEINLSYATQQQIPVIRRISGGGTVIHDLGNINFTYITTSLTHLNDYQYFLQPIVTVLNKLGISTTFVPKCHIYLDDKKISGNAQTFYQNKVLHHGTILFHADLNQAHKLLHKEVNVVGKYVDSVRAEITNIKDKIAVKASIEEVMSFVQSEILLNDTSKQLFLTEKDIARIEQIAKDKYQSFAWNYGEMKSFEIKNELMNITIDKGMIIASSIDALLHLKIDYNEVESALKNHPNKAQILKTIF
jgi:lipoate-protein ligase A